MYHTSFGALASPSAPKRPPGWASSGADSPGSGGECCDRVAYELWHCWLSSLQRCVWEAAYIACGVPVFMAPVLITSDQDLKSQDEFHQQMLVKLALHLASQPAFGPAGSPRQQKPDAHLPRTPESPSEVAGYLLELGSTSKGKAPGVGGKGAKGAKDGRHPLGRQDREHHQQMLRMLALHLAAQPDAPHGHPGRPPQRARQQPACDDAGRHGEPRGRSATRPALGGVLGGRPSSRGARAQRGGKEQRSGPGPDQEFQQEMLRKLALHLAAQPDAQQDSPRASPYSREEVEVQMIRTPESPSDLAELARELVPRSTKEEEEAGRASWQPSWEGCVPRPLPVHPMQSCQQQQDFHQQMLQKLALHLAAQPEPPCEGHGVAPQLPQPARAAAAPASRDGPGRAEAPPSGLQLDAAAAGEDRALCDRMAADLEPPLDGARGARAAQIMAWVASGARALSLTQFGSRLVQQAVAVASSAQREQLAEALLRESRDEDPTELFCSPHANHVVAKLIAVMPPARLGRVGEAMRGEATSVARHQFGSRVLERLIEHCGENQIGFLLDEIMGDFEALARHQFGNFVVQRTLEHCSKARMHACVEKLLPHVLKHATHKTASNVVGCLLAHSDLDCQAAIADVFLAGRDEMSLETIAATRYGSFVVHHLVDRFHPRIDAVKARVKAAHQQLQESSFSRQKIVNFLGESFFLD